MLGGLRQARGFSVGDKTRQGIRKKGINIQVLLHCEACGAISLVHRWTLLIDRGGGAEASGEHYSSS